MGKLFHVELKRNGGFLQVIGDPTEGDFTVDMIVGDQLRFHTSEKGTVKLTFAARNDGLKTADGKPVKPDLLPFDTDVIAGSDLDLKVVNSCKSLMTSFIEFPDGSSIFCHPETTVCTGGGNSPVVCH